ACLPRAARLPGRSSTFRAGGASTSASRAAMRWRSTWPGTDPEGSGIGLGDTDGLGFACHQVVDLGHGLLEARLILLGQDIVLGQLDAERVDQIAVDEDFEMQVRAGRLAGRADIADDLALSDLTADAEPVSVARHVAIGGLVAVDVLDLDLVAVAGLPLVILDD